MNAIEAGYGRTTPSCQRTAKIRELQAQHLSLEEIGFVFGITRERVRQIAAGQSVTPCRCPDCRRARLP
jgi:hypothetical protein